MNTNKKMYRNKLILFRYFIVKTKILSEKKDDLVLMLYVSFLTFIYLLIIM